MVRLKEQNMAEEDPGFWQSSSYDVIFCANVLMYFSSMKRTESIARFAGAIAPDGFLFLAHSETLVGVSNDFHLQQSRGCFYYSRQPSGFREFGKGTAPAGDLLAVRSVRPSVLPGGSLTEAIRTSAQPSSTLSGKSVPETGERKLSALAHGAAGSKSKRSVCFEQAVEAERAISAA